MLPVCLLSSEHLDIQLQLLLSYAIGVVLGGQVSATFLVAEAGCLGVGVVVVTYVDLETSFK